MDGLPVGSNPPQASSSQLSLQACGNCKEYTFMAAQGVLAATLVRPGHYEIREYPLPEPAADCVVVKMEMSGICGTDKHTFQGYTTQYGGRKLEFPIIQGHENVGTIAAIGGNGKYADFEGIPL